MAKTHKKTGGAAAGFLGLLVAALASGPAAAQARCGDAVTVSPGDTLYRIASRCGTTIPALLAANPQIGDPDRIMVGARLEMPGDRAGRERASRQPPETREGAGDGYVVRRGDTLAGIARSFGVPLPALIAMNPDIDPRYLRPGLRIRVPGDGRRRAERPGRGDRDGRRGRDRRGDNRISVSGTITREGVECPALRAENGRLYTLAGDTGRFGPGDRVRVRGARAQASICQQGTTIEVERIRAARGGGDRDGVTVTGTLTGEGAECPVLRGDNGRLYSLAGDIGRFRPGDRIHVRGALAQVSYCMQGTTITVERVRAAG